MKKQFIFIGIRLEALEAFRIFFDLKYVITTKGSFVEKLCKKKRIKHYLVNKYNKSKILNILLKEKKCKILCSAGFPYILPVKILKRFDIKINSHPSILPKYKGRSPIKQSYKNNDKKIGVTLHRMIGKVDSGSIIYQNYIIQKNLKLKEIYNIIFKYLEPFVIITGIQKLKI